MTPKHDKDQERAKRQGADMITPEYLQMMARYNRWQNQSIYSAASSLTGAARQQDRGAFFGSIHDTLSHLLWGDTLWMSRFDGWDAPQGTGPKMAGSVNEWPNLVAARQLADDRILHWAARVSGDDLRGDLRWYSGAMGCELNKPRAMLMVHMFNHQTHHRGQAHAMLTAAGAKPDDTDIPFMQDTKESDDV